MNSSSVAKLRFPPPVKICPELVMLPVIGPPSAKIPFPLRRKPLLAMFPVKLGAATTRMSVENALPENAKLGAPKIGTPGWRTAAGLKLKAGVTIPEFRTPPAVVPLPVTSPLTPIPPKTRPVFTIEPASVLPVKVMPIPRPRHCGSCR